MFCCRSILRLPGRLKFSLGSMSNFRVTALSRVPQPRANQFGPGRDCRSPIADVTGWTCLVGNLNALPSLQTPDLSERAYLNECREQEARRIAQNLHDEAGQLLATVHIKLDQVLSEVPREHTGSLEEIKLLLDQVGTELRQLSHELRPSLLDNLGLLPAIEFLANGIAKRTGLTITVEGSTQGRLSPMVETALYRTVQEALTNISKHAHARCAHVHLWRDSQVHCLIRDDGVGVNVAAMLKKRGRRGLGWIGMMERIEALRGTLLVASAPGKGMEIRASIPVEYSQPQPAFGTERTSA